METTPLTSVDEDARRRFETAWRNGQPEPIEKFLPLVGHRQFLATLEELILIEMEMAWKRFGQAETGADVPFLPLVEQYLIRFPSLRANEIALRLVRQEFLVRHRYGDRPEAGEYKARFPQVVQTGEEVETLTAGDHVPAPVPIIPGYDILEELGHGGMGVVYKARQHSLKRVVALKMMLSARATEQDLSRFSTETEAVAQLQHPNIAQIYEVGEYGRRPYCALEFVDGGTLGQKIDGTPQPAQVAATMVEQLARAVQSAHDKGIIHRDLKPANVLLTAAGLPKITDFGLAKRLEGDSSQTQSGTILGTPSYMAPEQAAGGRTPVGQPADVYGLGAVLYELLTGRPPFKAETVFETLQQVLTDEPVPPKRLQSKVPRDLETICLTCLRKEPKRRYPSASALADDLGRFLRGEPIVARPVGRIEQTIKWAKRRPAAAGLLVAVVMLVAGGLSGLFVWQQMEHNRLQREHEYEQAQLKMERDRAESLAVMGSSAAAEETSAIKEVQAGRFDAAELIFKRAAESLSRESLLADRRDELEKKRKRAQRLHDFYRLTDRCEWLAFNDRDSEAMATCQACLKRAGVLKHGKDWPGFLTKDWPELDNAQRERLRKHVNACFMLWTASRIRQGLVLAMKDNPKEEEKARGNVHLQGALDLLDQVEDADRWQLGRLGKLMCRYLLKQDFSKILALPKQEPLNGYDYYGMGIIHVWVAFKSGPGATVDPLSKGILKIAGGLDLTTPGATGDAMLRKATELEPNHYWSYYWLAWSYLSARPEEPHAAEMAFSKCIAIRPNFGFAFAERGMLRTRWMIDNNDEPWRKALQRHAQEDYKQALDLAGDDSYVRWLHALGLNNMGRRPEAVAECAQAVELEAPLRSLDGRPLERNTTQADQVKDGLMLWMQNGLSDAEAQAAVAQAWLVLDREQAAHDAAVKVLDKNAKQPRALAVRGAVSLRRGQFKEALSDFEMALAQKPTLFLAAAGRARVLELLTQFGDALEAYTKIGQDIAKTDWQHLEAHLGRARALAALGRSEDARAALEQAEEISPGIMEAVGKK